MVNLRQKPYYLSEEDIAWVENTISNMSDREKVGQLFVNMVTSRKPEDLKAVVDHYHVGGIRFHSAPAEVIYEQNKVLQENTKIPLLIAANCEAGGASSSDEATFVANGAALTAINEQEAVYKTAQVAASEAAAVGCNWNFAPVVDLLYNWRNTVVQVRAFGNDVEETVSYTKTFYKGMREQNIGTLFKHFPGDGTEENDQHLLMGVNNMSCEEWDQTFGKVYQELIDDGVMSIMAGHIALPQYSKKIRPGMKDEEILPATLAPELITDLLKEQLGFNGLVVTDASHMIGMFAAMPRREQVLSAITAGCDMFLFFNDVEEDFGYMMEGYKSGLITEERMQDALRRILGMKAALGLNKRQVEGTLVPSKEDLFKVVGCDLHQQISAEIADRYVTLVKDTKQYLPLTPAKYKRIKLHFIKGAGKVIAGKLIPDNSEEIKENVIRALEVQGYEVNAEQEAIKGKMEEFRSRYDACLVVMNIVGFSQFNTMRIRWDLPISQPWYVSELPTVFLSLNFTNHLIDIPMAKTYINAYSNCNAAIEAAVEKIAGKSTFKGRYNENVFCDRWDTRI